MRKPQTILKELMEVKTISTLASVFEGIASMEIGKIRDKTLTSKQFFAELWNIYSQLRVEKARLVTKDRAKAGRTLYIAITSQGGLSGDIDARVIEAIMRDFDRATMDIITIGDRGLNYLTQRGVPVMESYPMPETRRGFGATILEPIIEAARPYGASFIFYQSYQSLTKQEASQLELISAVKALGEEASDQQTEIISSRDYEFEPSLEHIVEYLESIMLSVVLSQVLFESTLSQAASRFNAMAGAKQRANEMESELRLNYNRARRAVSEERTREIIAVLGNLH